MTFWKNIRPWGESTLAGAACVIVPLFTRPWIIRMARTLGNVAFRVSRREREVALANLDLAFGTTLSREQKTRIARAAFQTFALVLLDLFWFGRHKVRRITKHVKFDPSFDYYLKTAPVIAVTAHLGNWEIMGQAAAVHGEPSVSVAAPLDNPFVDRILTRLRKGTGQEIVEQSGAVRTLMRTLKEGGRTALLMDQNILPQQGGEFVNLFGLPVPISKSAAGLASHTGAAIVFTYCVADTEGNYQAYALPPIRASEQRHQEKEVTHAIAQMLENVIKKHPDQWLWMYKRWKFIPDGKSPNEYPFYARRLKTEDSGEQE